MRTLLLQQHLVMPFSYLSEQADVSVELVLRLCCYHCAVLFLCTEKQLPLVYLGDFLQVFNQSNFNYIAHFIQGMQLNLLYIRIVESKELKKFWCPEF